MYKVMRQDRLQQHKFKINYKQLGGQPHMETGDQPVEVYTNRFVRPAHTQNDEH